MKHESDFQGSGLVSRLDDGFLSDMAWTPVSIRIIIPLIGLRFRRFGFGDGVIGLGADADGILLEEGDCEMGRISLSKALDAAGSEARYDECIKRILSELSILAWILKGSADEFSAVPVAQIEKECIVGVPQIAVDQDDLNADEAPVGSRIEGLNTEDSSIKEGKIFYDIRFTAVAPGTNEPIPLIVNIEAQNRSKDAYLLLKRAVYYVGRMISAQKNTVFTGDDYKKYARSTRYGF